MFERLGKFVSNHWLIVVISWVVVVALLRWLAPAWNDITCDGDLAYLPARMPSIRGEKLLADAFPFDRPKSQIAVYIAREDDKIGRVDLLAAYDLARRLKNLHVVAALTQSEDLAGEAQRLRLAGQMQQAEVAAERAEKARLKAASSIDEAIRFDDLLVEHWEEENEKAEKGTSGVGYERPQRLGAAYFNRALLNQARGEEDQAATDRELALELEPNLAGHDDRPVPIDAASLPLLDVWTWQDDVFGARLKSKHTRLIMLHLSNEFMATDNIRVLDYLEGVLDSVRQNIPEDRKDNLQIGFSGSAAVGGDLLRSAKDSIENTELFTIILVVLILSFVYRSPMLVAMPLITISVSLMVATSIIALLTQLNQIPGLEWWHFKVFTTTRIFIVVILFGAGTDYFLFLASRYKEELERGYGHSQAIARALAAVGDALAASALTTILGLATMFFADFGKFANSGPAIGLCLAVTLLACITLAPALLRALGAAVFWPFGIPRPKDVTAESDDTVQATVSPGRFSWLWERVARLIVTYPGWIMTVCTLLLLWPAYHGLHAGGNVTYDFLRQLPDDRPSKQGAELMARHFPVGEGGPLTVVAYKPDGAFDTKEGREKIRTLNDQLYVDGVTQVRSIADPLGDFPPDAQVGLFRPEAWRKRAASEHPRSMEIFVATQGEYAGGVTRLDLILDCDPFSPKAEKILGLVEQKLKLIEADPDSPWHGATFAYAGIAASIRDLKLVTQSDNLRIQILVVLAVLAVLLVILRRPLVCIYMIATVLFSYFVTIGVTEWFFAWSYGPSYQGLDWKVPLFLFVILVAIGQDYNVYLATRVFEEQARLGMLPGLQHAVVRTGGIITSCGVIMAGTFISMTSGTWGPTISKWIPAVGDLMGTQAGALPAIVQLGFALALGVMLDTFIVRPILVPAFLALLARFQFGTVKEVA